VSPHFRAADQIYASFGLYRHLEFSTRTIEDHHHFQLRELLGVRDGTIEDGNKPVTVRLREAGEGPDQASVPSFP
jgi:hypothetical protein